MNLNLRKLQQRQWVETVVTSTLPMCRKRVKECKENKRINWLNFLYLYTRKKAFWSDNVSWVLLLCCWLIMYNPKFLFFPGLKCLPCLLLLFSSFFEGSRCHLHNKLCGLLCFHFCVPRVRPADTPLSPGKGQAAYLQIIHNRKEKSAGKKRDQQMLLL